MQEPLLLAVLATVKPVSTGFRRLSVSERRRIGPRVDKIVARQDGYNKPRQNAGK